MDIAFNNEIKNEFIVNWTNNIPTQITTPIELIKQSSWLEIIKDSFILVFYKKSSPKYKMVNNKYKIIDKNSPNINYIYYNNIPGSKHNYSANDYEKVLLKLKYNGHIKNWNNYKIDLEKFQKKYLSNKSLQELIEDYLTYYNDLATKWPHQLKLKRNEINEIEYKLRNSLNNLDN